MKRGLLFFVLFLPLLAAAEPVDTGAVVNAINALGLDLYRTQAAGDGNLVFSPYSIQNALAMTYAGAAGDTRAEMQRVLHYPADDTALNGGFAELARELAQIAHDSAKRAEEIKSTGGDPNKPIEFHLANRLFVQKDYPLRAHFLALVKDNYGALPGELDFAHLAEDARTTINQWAEDNTKGKIQNLIPPDGLSEKTRLVLANAVYLFATWGRQFVADATKPEPFFVRGTERVSVPTMWQRAKFGYAHHSGFTILALPYEGGDLQFLILLPGRRKGLPALERKITPELLVECAKLPLSDVILYLPKFKLDPQSIALSNQLRQLGMKTAFDEPIGSANFDGMAPRKPNDYLAIDKVFHKAFFKLDEEGTEAAAATNIIVIATFGAEEEPPPEPIEVHVDHPFIFAIQHVPSGECLFLGRVTDPR
jgi:serpin B